MADFPSLQTVFNAGEQDPLLASRVDIEQYYQGARYIRNGLVVPQGGVSRRPGLQEVDDLLAGKTDGREIDFEYGKDGSKYLFIFTDDKLQIFEGDVEVFSTTTAAEVYDVLELPLLTWTQNDEVLITFHEDHVPRRYVRGATSAAWTIEDIPWSVIPQYSFEDTAGANTDHVHELFFSPSFAVGNRFTIFVNGQETGQITYSNVPATMAANLDAGIAALRGVGAVTVANVPVVADHYQITFDGPIQNSGQEFTVTEGESNIDNTASNNFITDTVITKGSLPVENVWSATRGYPRCGTFFQGRLWLGGSTERPQTLWASMSNNIYFFNDETDADDFAINVTVNSDSLSEIRQVHAGRHLQIFTSDGEYYVPESDNKVITPRNIVLRSTTSRGIKAGTQVLDVDGATLFLEKDGRSLRRFVFDDSEQSYTADNLSLLSSHVFNGIARDIIFRKSSSTDEADYVLVPLEDGNLAMYCTLFSQNVSAWTVQHTRGLFIGAVVHDDQMYFLVDRGAVVDTTPGNSHLYLEKFNRDYHFDSAVKGTGVASSATLAWLDGMEDATPIKSTYGHEPIGAILDGNIMDDDKDNVKIDGGGGGVVNFDFDSVANWEVGLWFGHPGVSNDADITENLTGDTADEVLIRTLPLESKDFGTLVGRKLRIREVAMVLHKTQHVKVKNSSGSSLKEVVFRELPTVMDSTPPLFTGTKRVQGMFGYDLSPTVDFIQSTSLKMHLLGVAIRASI